LGVSGEIAQIEEENNENEKVEPTESHKKNSEERILKITD